MAGNENTLNIQKSGPGLATVVIIYIQILTTATTAVGSSSEERETLRWLCYIDYKLGHSSLLNFMLDAMPFSGSL